MDSPTKSSQQHASLSEQNKKIYNLFPKNVKNFYDFHGVQMYGCNFPMTLVQPLYNKLSKAVSDAG